MVGWLIGWLVGWLVGWMVGWLVGWLVGWMDGWMDWLVDNYFVSNVRVMFEAVTTVTLINAALFRTQLTYRQILALTLFPERAIQYKSEVTFFRFRLSVLDHLTLKICPTKKGGNLAEFVKDCIPLRVEL